MSQKRWAQIRPCTGSSWWISETAGEGTCREQVHHAAAKQQGQRCLFIAQTPPKDWNCFYSGVCLFSYVHMGVKILDCKYCIHFFLFNDWSSIAAKKNKKKGSTWCLERVIFLYLMPSGFIRGIIEKFLLELFHILFLWYDEFTGLVFFCTV